MKHEFSGQFFFQKYSNIQFHENPFSVNLLEPCGQTDRHDEAISRFSQILRTHGVDDSTQALNFQVTCSTSAL